MTSYNPLPSLAESIKNTIETIKTTISSEHVSESATLFLQIIECTATLVPIFGPVIVLGAQIAQLPGKYDELKEQIEYYSTDALEYADMVNKVSRELNQMFLDNMNKITNIHNSGILKGQLDKLERSKDLITMTLSEYDKYLKVIFDYNPKISNINSRFNMEVFTKSTTTIESKINSFRISLISAASLFLFEIQSITITTISDITTAIQTTNTQVQTNITNIGNITAELTKLQSELQAVQANLELSKAGGLNNANTITISQVSTTGGYKFKLKKIKRKLNKIKRKTKNNRKIKNKRKTKKYI
jgi:hypothetical protein